jgi:hypothetical protein
LLLNKKKNPVYILKNWEGNSSSRSTKANKSMRTHVTKEHNFESITNINKIKDHKLKKPHLPQFN